jgi:hypothetical protein
MQNQDTIRIDSNRYRKFIKSALTVLSFRDNDTKQYIKYAPSLELSGYGKTVEKAEEMLKTAIQDELRRLIDLPVKQVRSYLSSFGWKPKQFHNKELSHVIVDKHGALQGFNVDFNSVTEEKLLSDEQIAVA